VSPTLVSDDVVLELDGAIVDIAVHAEGIVLVSADGAVVRLDAESGRMVWRLQIADDPLCVEWAPDASAAVIGTTTGAVLLDADAGHRVDLGGGWCQAVAWSANSAHLALGQGRWAAVVDRDGQPMWSWQASSTVTGLKWADRRIAVSSYGGVVLHEPRSGRVAQTMPFKGSLLVLAVSPNRRWVVSGNQDATLHAWRIGRDNDELTMQGYPAKITALGFSSDSRFLACNGSHEVSVWDFSGQGPSGTKPRILRGHADLVQAVAFAPSASHLVTAGRDGQIAWFDVAKAVPGRPMGPHGSRQGGSAALCVRWIDEDRVVAGFADGSAALLAVPLGTSG
jgi:WD40 repeat protein